MRTPAVQSGVSVNWPATLPSRKQEKKEDLIAATLASHLFREMKLGGLLREMKRQTIRLSKLNG